MTDSELRDAVLLLMAKLVAANQMYENNQREGVRAAIASLGIFVTKISHHGDVPGLSQARLDDMLGHLSLALAGLDQGSIDPLLAHNAEARRRSVDAEQDKKRGRKPGMSLQEQMQRAVVAASLHGLYKAGFKLEQAAVIVVRELKGSPLLAGAAGRPSSAVRRWRTDITDASEKRCLSQMPHDAPPGKMAAGAYNEMVAGMERRLAAGAPKRMVADFAVNLLKFGFGMPHSDLHPRKPKRRLD
jgi:hypothetical protein